MTTSLPSRQPKTGLRVFDAQSIERLDALAAQIMNTSGSGRICIVFEGGPGHSHWRFDEVTFKLDSEAFRNRDCSDCHASRRESKNPETG